MFVEKPEEIHFYLDSTNIDIEIRNRFRKPVEKLLNKLDFIDFQSIVKIYIYGASFENGDFLYLQKVLQSIRPRQMTVFLDSFNEEKNQILESRIMLENPKIKQVKISTYCAYDLMLKNHIGPFFDFLCLHEIDEETVQRFIYNKTNQLSSKSIKDLIVVIKMILVAGTKKKYCQMPHFDLIYPKSSKEGKVSVFTKTDQKKLTDYLLNNFEFKNLGLLICLYTGIRIGEISAIKWSDIDVHNNSIAISRTLQRIYRNGKTEIIEESCKTDKSIRTIPLCKILIKFIKPLKRIVNDDFYVISNTEKPIEPRTYRVYFKKILEKLGLPKIKFHSTRHTFATRLIESKADVKTVSSILGHSNVSTTLNLYVHPNDEQKKKSIEKAFKYINSDF